MRKAIICDLDGTLCNIDHRIHFLKKKDWDAFDALLDDDSIHLWCQMILETFAAKGCAILYVTARSEINKSKTLNWLRKHSCTIDGLYMRSPNDYREDSIVKEEIYKNKIKDKFEVLFCLDDRVHVAEMWRSLGLTCLLCSDN
jgi:hydroxymethylpyrimidine pyrophosphatase-like HAD family hydrolase